MAATPPNDWTNGPAKWAAVVILGCASIFGMAWSIQTRHNPVQGPPPFQVRSPQTISYTPPPQPAVVTPPAAALSTPAQPILTPVASPDVAPTTAPELTPAAPASLPEAPEPEPAQPAPEPPTPAPPAAPVVPPDPPAPTPAPPSVALKININTADAAQLELLPGIGPALASRIIEDRRANGPFRTIDDLDRVKGIGPRTLEKLRPLITVK